MNIEKEEVFNELKTMTEEQKEAFIGSIEIRRVSVTISN